MALTWLPYVKAHYEPACYDDYLVGKTLYQRLAHGTTEACLVEIVVVDEQCCDTIAGPTHFLTWRWKDCDLQVHQGHLHDCKFEDEVSYQNATTCPCRLFVQRTSIFETHLTLRVYLKTYNQ